MIKNRKSFKIPHSFVIMFLIILLLAILSYVIPAGKFNTHIDHKTNMEVINPDSFHFIEKNPATIFDVFKSIQLGFVDGASVIFLIFFACFAIYVIVDSGSMHAGIGALMRFMKGKEKLIIPVFIIIFALTGSTYGEWDTVYGLIPLFVGLSIALGYDALVGVSMSMLAVSVGFASATTNPFTVVIAQEIAELPIFSGLAFRWFAFFIFVSITIIYTMKYANKVKLNPSSSLVADVDFSQMKLDENSMNIKFTNKHKLTLIILFVGLITIVLGTLKWNWYLDEMSAAFLMLGIFVSLLWKHSPDKIADNLVQSTKEVIVAGFVIGFSRAILIIINETNMLDTIIYAMYLPLKQLPRWIAAEGMLVLQTLINFFIPSGSGQAATTMPIMIPLADSLGINRQIAVLAFIFGDGFTKLLWPTGSVFVMSSLSNIPVEKWYKYFLKLYLILFIFQSILMYLAMFINYGPF